MIIDYWLFIIMIKQIREEKIWIRLSVKATTDWLDVINCEKRKKIFWITKLKKNMTGKYFFNISLIFRKLFWLNFSPNLLIKIFFGNFLATYCISNLFVAGFTDASNNLMLISSVFSHFLSRIMTWFANHPRIIMIEAEDATGRDRAVGRRFHHILNWTDFICWWLILKLS